MKFSCTQENLKRGLSITSSVAGKNINLPILNNVLIRIENNSIRLVATNLEIAVTCTVRGKVEEAGEFTVPSKLFMDFVNLLPDERVDIVLEEDALKVSCGKNSTKIKGIPAHEFPPMPKIDKKAVFHLPAAVLRKALSQVTFAVSGVESRPELTGVLFNVNPPFAPGKLVLAATDSYRLSEKTITLKDAPKDKTYSVIVPGKTLLELSRGLAVYKDAEITEPVEVAIGESQVFFRFGEVELISRVIEGRYPDYHPIIPERFSTEANLDQSDLIQAVKSAALFSRAGLQDVHLAFDPSEGVEVSSNEGQLGKNRSMVPGAVKGQKNAITVNYRYFLDGANAVDAGEVKVKMIDGMNPCVITAEGGGAVDEKLLYIVMPIKQ